MDIKVEIYEDGKEALFIDGKPIGTNAIGYIRPKEISEMLQEAYHAGKSNDELTITIDEFI